MATTTQRTIQAPASPKKLRDGSWGAIVQTRRVQPGDQIQIKTRAGKSWNATVSSVVWSGEGKAIVTTDSGGGARSGGRRRGSRQSYCAECGERIEERDQRCWETGGVCFPE